jgi:hypothetical protein
MACQAAPPVDCESTRTPSIINRVWRVSAPRSSKLVVAAGPPLRVNSTPGKRLSTSPKELKPACDSVSRSIRLTSASTSVSGWAVRVAVTMTSLKAATCCAHTAPGQRRQTRPSTQRSAPTGASKLCVQRTRAVKREAGTAAPANEGVAGNIMTNQTKQSDVLTAFPDGAWTHKRHTCMQTHHHLVGRYPGWWNNLHRLPRSAAAKQQTQWPVDESGIRACKTCSLSVHLPLRGQHWLGSGC